MQGELYSLTYISRAAPGLSDEEVFRIYKTATELNAIDGVTGLMVFDGSVFMQIIEGGREAIDALMRRLDGDPRHRELHIVDEREIEQRSFADWSMKLVQVNYAHMSGIENLEAVLGPRVQPDIRAMLLDNVARMGDAA